MKKLRICKQAWTKPYYLAVKHSVITACTVVYKLLYNPWAKSMGEGDFRPPQLRDPWTDFH